MVYDSPNVHFPTHHKSTDTLKHSPQEQERSHIHTNKHTTYTRTDTRKHTRTSMHTHTQEQAHTHKNKHIHTRTGTHSHTYTQE